MAENITFTMTESGETIAVVINELARGPVGPAGTTTWSGLTGGTANHIPFDTNPTAVPTTEGTVSWNADDHTLDIQTEVANTKIQAGQESVIRVRNSTGSTLTDGTVVYITGATGQRATIAKAVASNASHVRATIGLVTSDIANNGNGYVTTQGLVRGVNTSAFAEGAVLYLSDVTAGAITDTATTENDMVRIGWCVVSGVNGTILVNVRRLSVSASDIIDPENIIPQGTALLENIEGLNRAFDDFMRFDNDTDASPHRLTLTGFADSMPGNPSAWIARDLQQRYGVGMIFTPNLGQSWNGATPTLTSCTADTTNYTRMPSACEYTIASGGSYVLTTPDISTNPLAANYMPSGDLTEARIASAQNTIPLPNGIQKIRVFYVKLPSAGTITVTLAQSQFSDVTGSADANAAEALGYIDVVPNDFFAPITLTVAASGGAVQFIGAAFMSGSGVGYWSSAKGSTKMDDQLPGLRSGLWNSVYKDLCTALGTSFVLHCQRATDAGTEANNAAANYQTFFDAYQDAGLGQVVFEEPHRDTENALTTDAINAILRDLCAAERIAFFRSKRAVLASSTDGLGWGDADDIHRDSREWRYVSGVFLAQVGYFRSAFSRYAVPVSRGAIASERFRMDSLSRARRSSLIGRGGVFSGTTHSGAPYGNPTVAADTGFGWVTVANTAGHSAGVIGQLLGGSSQLETSAGDITIVGNGYRNLSLPAGGGQSAALVFGQSSSNVTDITAITTRSFGLEFRHGTDIGGGLGATEYVRIWAHNGTAITYSRWVVANTSGGPSSNGISFVLQWRKDLATLILWMNGHNLGLFPRASLPVSALASANTAASYVHGYVKATGTGHSAGKMQWLELGCEFGTLTAPFAY